MRKNVRDTFMRMLSGAMKKYFHMPYSRGHEHTYTHKQQKENLYLKKFLHHMGFRLAHFGIKI